MSYSTQCYAPDGSPMDWEDYTDFKREHPELWRVARDSVADVGVSTVWLGMDHGHGDGPPLIYETLVSGINIERIERYSTREQAERGHREMVRWARETAWRRRLANWLLDVANRVGGDWYAP